MRFCDDHWSKLRTAIEARGLAPLVAQGDKAMAAKLAEQVDSGTETIDNYDPMMGSFFAICGNAFGYLSQAGTNPLYLMQPGPEDPVDAARAGEKYAGRTWPKCPMCYLNLAHELTCTDEKCSLDKEKGYDWMIDKAADEAKMKVDRLMAGGTRH